ncbi:hypothetical protein RQP46_006634 [Phenoliferia psychrophenolica]
MDNSFVLVEREDDSPFDSAELRADTLSKVTAYFPSLSSASSFNVSAGAVDVVRATRSSRPDSRLFIDELLQVLSLDGSEVFPPTSAAGLESLLVELLRSEDDLLTAHCIIFYLLLFLNPPNSPIPTAFIRNVHLPVGHTRTIEGFSALDGASWHQAVSALTDPHLVGLDKHLIHKTLNVLAQCPPANERAKLVLSYWRLADVTLESEEQAHIIIDALCDHRRKLGVVEAWAMQRNWPDDEARERLARTVLLRCFGDNDTSSPAPEHLRLLLAHPFTPAEDAITSSFCLAPSPSITARPALAALAADWFISKLIATGRPVDALRFGRQLSTQGALRGSDERNRLLRAVRETLTEVQRNEVDLESDAALASRPAAAAAATSNVTQPAWQPVPAAAPPAPVPRSLLSLAKSPAPSPTPTTTVDLPLSASPFLRHEKGLVSSSSGTALGGSQKTVLRALRESNSTAPVTPDKGKGRASDVFTSTNPAAFNNSPARSDNGSAASFFQHASPRTSSTNPPLFFGAESPRPQDRRPTLSGFGSRRVPSSLSLAHDLGSFAAEPSQPITALSPPPPLPASAPSAPPITKRRNLSAQHTASVQGDKRRAVSTEAEDRPSSSLKIPSTSTSKVVPGGFPGHDSDDSDFDSAPKENTRRRKPVVPTRRSARASSAALQASPKKEKDKVMEKDAAGKKKQEMATRRSSRRLASVQPEEPPKRTMTTRKSTAGTSRRKAAADE